MFRKRLRVHHIFVVLAPVVFFIVGLYLLNKLDGFGSDGAPVADKNQKVVVTATATLANADNSSPPQEVPPQSGEFGEGGLLTQTPLLVSEEPLPILSPVASQLQGLITHGDRSQRSVALTFDVCERADEPAGFDQDIIDVLLDNDIPATFFLSGLWIAHNQEKTEELAANSRFELGNHAWSHLDFAQISAEQMESEIVLTQQAMWELLGWQTKLFRLPYGTYNEEALAVINDHGLYTIQWDVVSGDPDPNITAEKMVPWVLGQVQPGSIIIMHANGRGWHTAEALPQIIEALQQQGYTFTTISEQLGLAADAGQPSH